MAGQGQLAHRHSRHRGHAGDHGTTRPRAEAALPCATHFSTRLSQHSPRHLDNTAAMGSGAARQRLASLALRFAQAVRLVRSHVTAFNSDLAVATATHGAAELQGNAAAQTGFKNTFARANGDFLLAAVRQTEQYRMRLGGVWTALASTAGKMLYADRGGRDPLLQQPVTQVIIETVRPTQKVMPATQHRQHADVDPALLSLPVLCRLAEHIANTELGMALGQRIEPGSEQDVLLAPIAVNQCHRQRATIMLK